MNSFVRKTLIFVLVMFAVAISGWYGRKVYKRATENRLLSEARQYLEKKDPRNASLCLQRALQVNPYSCQASILTADMLEAAGTPAALSWRIHASQLQTNNMELRLAWAHTALKLNELRSAAQALDGLDDKTKHSAAYHKLAGALTWEIGLPLDAEREYTQALKLEPTNNTIKLNLATIQLVSTNPIVANAARASLLQIPAASPLRSTALHYLALDAEKHKDYPKAIVYSREIISATNAGYVDKVAHLQLLREANSPDYAAWRSTMDEDARKSPDHAYAMGRWLVASESPAAALQWIRKLPVNIQTNMPVPLVSCDCLISVKDWPGVLAVAEKQDWGEAEFYRLALVAYAEHSQGHQFPEKTAWQKAMNLASHRIDRLARLDEVTAIWNWTARRDEVLQEVLSEFPREKWAADQLMASLYAQGNTGGLGELLEKLYTQDPSNNRLKNNLANIFLLRKSDLDKAGKMAREVYESSPQDPFFTSTYAYALLLQDKVQDAAKVAGTLKTNYLTIPSIAAYYGVVEAHAGHKDLAREPLKLAASASLLPEEREMVRVARSTL
jgi:predicted Zn-dependent protease